MCIYSNYEHDGYKLVVLYYVDDYVCLYTYEKPGKLFIDTLGKILHMNFLGYVPLVYAH